MSRKKIVNRSIRLVYVVKLVVIELRFYHVQSFMKIDVAVVVNYLQNIVAIKKLSHIFFIFTCFSSFVVAREEL